MWWALTLSHCYMFQEHVGIALVCCQTKVKWILLLDLILGGKLLTNETDQFSDPWPSSCNSSSVKKNCSCLWLNTKTLTFSAWPSEHECMQTRVYSTFLADPSHFVVKPSGLLFKAGSTTSKQRPFHKMTKTQTLYIKHDRNISEYTPVKYHLNINRLQRVSPINNNSRIFPYSKTNRTSFNVMQNYASYSLT